MKYFYKDFETGKERYTRAPFVGWTKGGLLNVRYAIFQRRSEDLLVPEYLLTTETKELLNTMTEDTQPTRVSRNSGTM